MGDNGQEIGVKNTITIKQLETGVTTVETEPKISAVELRKVLMQAWVELSDELIVNKALQLLDIYLTNVKKQQEILTKIKGGNA